MQKILTVLFLFGGMGAWADVPFEYEYLPSQGKLPQDSSPVWAMRHRGAEVKILDGHLMAETPGGERGFFVIGKTDDGQIYGAPNAWDGQPGKATVDFRVKCSSDESEFEIFQVQLSDGVQSWRIRFYNNRLYPEAKAIDPTVFDTYRATMENGKLTLSSASKGVIFKDRPGIVPMKSEAAGNSLWFGSFSPNAKLPQARGTWELDYIRWTNKTAEFEAPSH